MMIGQPNPTYIQYSSIFQHPKWECDVTQTYD